MREHDPKNEGGPSGHSRRDFLRGSSLAAATAVLTGQATTAIEEAQAAQEAGPKVLSGQVEITLKVNGADQKVSVEPRSTLLDTLRNRLDVTGPKRVCDRAATTWRVRISCLREKSLTAPAEAAGASLRWPASVL